MGFAEIIGSLAMLVALAALWLVSDVMKKLDEQNRVFVETHIVKIRDTVADCVRRTDSIIKEMQALEKKGEAMNQLKAETEKGMAALAKAIRDVSDQVSKLDRSIPQKYRAGGKQPGAAANEKHPTNA